MPDLPRWMQKPEQPAAGTDAATSPANATPPGGAAAPRVTDAPKPPLRVSGSPLDALVQPEALKAAAAVEDQRAQELGDAMDAPPAKPSGYNFLEPPYGSGVEPMSPAVKVAAAQLLHSFGASEGLAQALVGADYAAQAAAAPRGEAALTASSSKAMHQIALGIQGETGASYEVARAEAAKLAGEVDDYMLRVAGKKDPRVAAWWANTNVSNDVALLKKLHAFIAREKQRAARPS